MKALYASVIALSLGACTGSVGGGGGHPNQGSAGSGGTTVVDPNNPQANCKPDASLASARISLLTETEYKNIMRDVFGVDFVPETKVVNTGDYPLDESAQVGSVDVAKRYWRAADQVAGKLKPCGSSPIAAPCVESFLRDKLPKAWKRPLTDAEISGLMAIFNGGLEDGEQRAFNLVMEAALGTGAFLYRTEVGTDASGPSGSVPLTAYELANALSFSVLATVPDDQLWAKAADGSITQPAVLAAEVDRLLALQPAKDILAKKVSFYLDIEKIPVSNKDATTFPEFTPTLQDSLYTSAQMFLNDLVWNGQLSDLFTSNKYYANEEIAKVYGLSPVQGSGLIQVDLPPERNAGFLTHPGLLATTNLHTSSDDVVHRGLWVYQNLVCGIAIGSPPANALTIASTFTGTDRQKTEQRDAMPICNACHLFFDPFGIASQNFDAIGRYRTLDPQDMSAIVSTSTIKGIGTDMDGPIASMKDVADKLKTGRRVADCAVQRLSQYTLDHNPNEENSCAIQKIKDNFAASGKFVDLFKAILTSPAFATRDLGK